VNPFSNEPHVELRRAPVREELVAALAALEATLPWSVPVSVGSDHRSADGLVSADPGEPERVVAVAGRATAVDVQRAVEAGGDAAREWGRRPASERAAALVGAAAVMRRRRRELAALQLRECAKPWVEADADVCEAIDFLEYYARQAIELERGRPLLAAPGERNTMRYAPRGVCAVISPWNFPLAIPTGMVAGALASGNAVILKPAEQSPASGLACLQALRDGGVPAAAIQLLPGEGDVGAALVRDPGVATIAFTGSRAAGLEIVEAAGRTAPGQRMVKRVIAEMGGKNCVIVDSDADLDDAVPAIVTSAFAYGGQKCSAAARVLVHEAIGDELSERLRGAVALLCVGQADDFATQVPPLIERVAQERVVAYQERAASEGRLVVRREPVPDRGWFVPPALAEDLPADSSVLADEIFGPLLTLERVPDVEAACDVVDGLDYALTGGLFSRNPRTVEYVASRTPVGNLYVNRQITGAMVGRQPFGGNRLSGSGLKAGGPDYLLQFVDPHVVTEDTMRHGLVV
jgi:RHH-type transcriptional regulator, proline utilization regulon repressor / proline dehydrogenase / delta 1-pyrroline-5-carboxylate dehydrogenase